jgi:hypothetical protein
MDLGHDQLAQSQNKTLRIDTIVDKIINLIVILIIAT